MNFSLVSIHVILTGILMTLHDNIWIFFNLTAKPISFNNYIFQNTIISSQKQQAYRHDLNIYLLNRRPREVKSGIRRPHYESFGLWETEKETVK